MSAAWIPGVVFLVGLPVCFAPFWWWHAMALFSRTTPVVSLVVDMLASDIGWSGSKNYPRHQTGIEVEGYSVETTSLRIGDQRVLLTGRDKWRIRRAVKSYAKRQTQRDAEKAAIALSHEIRHMAERVQAMAENVVPIGIKREDAA